MQNYKLSFVGGLLFSWSYSLSVGEIYKTIFLATIGAIVSFLVSYLLRKFLKK